MDKLSKKEKSRRKIMHAATGLFERDGIDNVTFGRIAEEADVCRTTVFNHFSGTAELMLAIMSQEIEDIRDFCREENYSGKELIYALFGKLIEDTAYYPTLATRLINNAILEHERDNPVKIIEEMTMAGLRADGFTDEESKRLTVLTEGAYFGLINHYHINDMKFEAEAMKMEFQKLLSEII